MKRVLPIFLVLTIAIFVFPMYANAAEKENNVVYFDDGSYMTAEVITNRMRASGSVTGNKIKTYYDSEGNTKWKAVLTGSFTYTGSSATCTSASIDVTIYDSNWYVVSKSASKSGNTASASVTMGKKVAGVTVSKVSANLTLSCDANGNLS
ncbi:MAG: hypothetical protein SPD81_03535 [Candidatus Faecousia sp.]|nr:hypothetical protein [Candidatus Faecousia sp.]